MTTGRQHTTSEAEDAFSENESDLTLVEQILAQQKRSE